MVWSEPASWVSSHTHNVRLHYRPTWGKTQNPNLGFDLTNFSRRAVVKTVSWDSSRWRHCVSSGRSLTHRLHVVWLEEPRGVACFTVHKHQPGQTITHCCIYWYEPPSVERLGDWDFSEEHQEEPLKWSLNWWAWLKSPPRDRKGLLWQFIPQWQPLCKVGADRQRETDKERTTVMMFHISSY